MALDRPASWRSSSNLPSTGGVSAVSFRFEPGVDFALVPASQKDEFHTFGIQVPNRGLTVFTRRGYLKLVKSLNDDLAWSIFDDMIDRYFAATAQPQIENGHNDELLADLAGRTETALARLQEVTTNEVTTNEVGSVRGYIKTGVVSALAAMAEYNVDRFKALFKRDERMIHDMERFSRQQEAFGRSQEQQTKAIKAALEIVVRAGDIGTFVAADWVVLTGIYVIAGVPMPVRRHRALSARIAASLTAYSFEVDRQMDVRCPPYDRTKRLYRAALVKAWLKDAAGG